MAESQPVLEKIPEVLPKKGDGIIEKLAFVALLIVIFYVSIRIISKLVMYFYKEKSSVSILNDMKAGNIRREIKQDPKDPNSVLIKRSVNRQEGIEFTYSCWININSVSQNDPRFKSVFFKSNIESPIKERCDISESNSSDVVPEESYCNSSITSVENLGNNLTGINYPDNGPGLYVFRDTDANNNVDILSLLVVMNTYKNVLEHIVIKNISLRKWYCVVIRVSGRNVDVYINGTIVKRHVLNDIPKQNYGSVFINSNNGFDGSISGLKYFSKALDIVEINKIVKKGPNLKIDKSVFANPPYLSSDWYFDNNAL